MFLECFEMINAYRELYIGHAGNRYSLSGADARGFGTDAMIQRASAGRSAL